MFTFGKLQKQNTNRKKSNNETPFYSKSGEE